jgi:glutamate-1-semialdehyde aminotransferase
MSASWMNVMVQFTHTNAYDQDALTRAEKYRNLRANAERHRQELEEWIAREGLQGEVKNLGEAMAFDLLFATVTPTAAAALNHAPGVVAVTPAPELYGPGGIALAYA